LYWVSLAKREIVRKFARKREFKEFEMHMQREKAYVV
jgi:hypothetical protein